jgi:hypothetical protein
MIANRLTPSELADIETAAERAVPSLLPQLTGDVSP